MLKLKLLSQTAVPAMLVVAIIFVLLILPLIGNVHDIEFQAGRGLDFSAAPSGGGPSAESPGASTVRLVVLILLRIAAVVFIFLLITDWRYRTFYIVSILFLFGILLMVEFMGLDEMPAYDADTPDSEDLWERPGEAEIIQPPEYRDVESSNIQHILLALALSSIVAIVTVWLLVKWLKRRAPEPNDGHDDILESITNAVRRLRAGEDARTVVLFCYQEMIRILSTEGKIDATYLTPREFELRLRGLGMSGESISQLTTIFEIVRYAGRVNGEFAALSLACLDSIREVHAIDES